jgi:hypothetical protein
MQTTSNTLWLRHTVHPMKAGDTLSDHATPMDNVIKQLTQTLKEFADFKQQHPDYATMKNEYQQMKNRITELEAEQS